MLKVKDHTDKVNACARLLIGIFGNTVYPATLLSKAMSAILVQAKSVIQ